VAQGALRVLVGAGLSCILAAAPLAAAASPIRIGATVSLSGKYSEPSRMVSAGYRLWASQINAQGGLLHRPVELLLEDDQSREDLVRRHYRAFIEALGVDLVLSPYGSPLTLAASEVSEPNGYVMMASAASADILFNRGYRRLFGVYAPANRYFIGLLDLMARHGMHSVAVLYEDNYFNRDVAAGAEKWARQFGLEVAFSTPFAERPTALPTALDDLRHRFPSVDGLIFSAYPPNCYRLMDLMRERGWRPPVLAQTIAPLHPDYYDTVGATAEGVFGPSQWEPDERIPFPGTQQFIHDFKAEYGFEPSYHAAAAYTACQILERAITSTGSLDQETLRTFIVSMDSVTVLGRFKVDHRGMQIGHNPLLIQWQTGRKEIVYPRKLQTAAPRMRHGRQAQ
jgi:branched-chain amino acid transport system substrate-binding protein